MFHDSDDMMTPDTIERMVEIINSGEAPDIIVPDFQMVPLGDEFREPAYDNGVEYLSATELQEAFLLRRIKILAPATLYNRQWYNANRLKFSKILYGEDQHFIWKMLLCVRKACHLKYPTYNYLFRPGSIMTSSKYDKIVAAYPSYKELETIYNHSENASPLVKKYLFPRYVLGIMHSALKLCNAKEYNLLCKQLEAKHNMKKLLRFPGLSTKVLALSYLISPALYKAGMKIIDSRANK